MKVIRQLRGSKGRMYEKKVIPRVISQACCTRNYLHFVVSLCFLPLPQPHVILMGLITHVHRYGTTALPCSSHIAIQSSLTYTKKFLCKKVSFLEHSMRFLCDVFPFSQASCHFYGTAVLPWRPHNIIRDSVQYIQLCIMFVVNICVITICVLLYIIHVLL